MPTKKIPAAPDIYQIKVTLFDTEPPVWRRLLVSAQMTLAQLHDVLQAAMGWEDCHLHEYCIGKERFGTPNPEDPFMGASPVNNERTVPLATVLGRMAPRRRTPTISAIVGSIASSWRSGFLPIRI
jgi:hypothetical protein